MTCAFNSATGCNQLTNPQACPSGQLCDPTKKACVADPCAGIPTSGVCSGTTAVQYCAVPTGTGQPSVQSFTCPTGEQCQTINGQAACKLVAQCHDGDLVCANVGQINTCQKGAWVTTACTNGCVDSALGAFCTPNIAVTQVSGTVQYDVIAPKADLSDWDLSKSISVPAPGFLILSFSGKTVVGVTGTDVSGKFTVNIPANPTSADFVGVLAAGTDGAAHLTYLVADPGFTAPGVQPQGTNGASPHAWSWKFPSSTISNGSILQITTAMGSGAARVFDYLDYAYLFAQAQYGGQLGSSLIVWLGYDTSWNCGSCFMRTPSAQFGRKFDSQIFLGGDTTDQPFWSDAVTAHELGHWVMASFGTSPHEGGPHYIGKTTFPGQGWSEGWATWFSSDLRQDPIYYDKQQGSMFWWSLGKQTYRTQAFTLPNAADGLLQLIDENEIAAMLWRLSSSGQNRDALLFAGLASAHMNISPWPRGYTRHTWDYDQSSNFTNVVDTGESKPSFPDFLDAIDCAGFPTADINAATVPATQYPYPSWSPICP